MEKNDPAVPIRHFVHWKIRWVVVRLLHELQLTEATVAHPVQFLYLLDHVRSVQIHGAERNYLRRMLLRCFGYDFPVRKRS